MKTRTIRDINSKNSDKHNLSPIRENEFLNDSHEFIVQNTIYLGEDDKYLAKSYNTQKDWQKLDEIEKLESKIKDKTMASKLSSRNKKKFSAKSFKMKSHILLPGKLLETQEEEERRREIQELKELEKLDDPFIPNAVPSGEGGSPFGHAPVETVMEFSKAIEDFNKDLLKEERHDHPHYEEAEQPLLFHTNSDVVFNRKNFRHNINSVIERDMNLFEDTGRVRVHSNYSIGDDIRTSNERSEISETTKNINTSFDDDKSNRKEEIEAAIESLEFKALTLLNDDDMMLDLCKAKVKEYFEKCMEDEKTSDEDLKRYIQALLKSKQSQSPAVGDLNSFEKVNEIITILSKIQYQVMELKNI